jgi:hypothetical protein
VRRSPFRLLRLEDGTGAAFAQGRPSIPNGLIMCDKAAPSAAVMLHLRARYVSKAAILGVPEQIVPVKIEVPFEFQGLGSLGAARGDGFSLASLTA